MTLKGAGLSIDQVVGALTYTALVLLFLFAFIFVGIAAFSLGGSFGSVVNSTIPLGGGMSVGSGGGGEDAS